MTIQLKLDVSTTRSCYASLDEDQIKDLIREALPAKIRANAKIELDGDERHPYSASIRWETRETSTEEFGS